MGFRSHVTAVTLRDLRIAKLSKQFRPTPCQALLESYMNGIQDIDADDSQIPVRVRLMLHRCLEEQNVSDYNHYPFVIIDIACYFYLTHNYLMNEIRFNSHI